MRIESARYENGELILSASPDARKLVYGFKAGDYELTKVKRKRSLDANAMMWKICSDIADAVHIPKEMVYRKAIKEVGTFSSVSIADNAVADFVKSWESHGTGWIAEVVDDDYLPDRKIVFAYKGSSQYDIKQMSRLIDYVIEGAKSIGIETLSERERSLLLDAWSCCK